MSYLKDTIVPNRVYNTLPLIEDNKDVPKNYAADLEVLRKLLVKHKVPDSINVRLIHRHYDAKEGEVMIFRNVKVPDGNIQVMQPVVAKNCANLHPVQYFVDKDQHLQAYEYTTDETPAVNLQEFQPFLKEFCRTASERGLERKFGLKIQDESAADLKDWSEYEYPSKRSTIIIPKGLPTPDDNSSGFSVNTEWSSESGSKQKGGGRCHSHCHKHCNKHGGRGKAPGGNPRPGGPGKTCNSHCSKHLPPRGKQGGGSSSDTASTITIGGSEVVAGSPFHRMMAAVGDAW
jgi:hypothetical protein